MPATVTANARRFRRVLVQATAARVRAVLGEPAVQVAWQAWWASRLLVFAVGLVAVLTFGRAAGTQGFDPQNLTAPFGYFGNLLVAPFARWDSVWYLTIARWGYQHQVARTEFFPFYPLTIHGLGAVIGSNLVAGILISLACFGVALVLLYRLAALELGAPAARACVLLVAFSPMAWAFSAVYTESLFLLLSLGCILTARSGSWGWAGVLGGLAAATRVEGITLVVPLAIMFLYGPRMDGSPAGLGGSGLARLLPRYRFGFKLAWLLLVPAGFGCYLLYLKLSGANPTAPFHAHTAWFRHFAWPWGGIWDGTVAAWDGLRQLVHGPAPPVYFTPAGGNPLVVAEQNLVGFGFLVAALVALVGALRRLPLAYGAYALVALALPLSYPVTPQPLQGLSRYIAVVFPLFMWAGWWTSRRRRVAPLVGGLAVLLGLFTVEFATWRFVA